MCNDCHWGLTENDSLIERGPDSEKIRLWLRSEGSFPEHVYPVAIPTRLTSERLSIKGLVRSAFTLLRTRDGFRQLHRMMLDVAHALPLILEGSGRRTELRIPVMLALLFIRRGR
jgi:hypothetical protein